MNQRVLRASDVLRDAIVRGIFPGAVAEVGSSDGVLWREAFGHLSFERDAPTTPSTIFDLASLTKPIATTSVVLHLVERGRMRLADPARTFCPEWVGDDRAGVSVRHLLEHASGLGARLTDAPPDMRRAFAHVIGTMPLAYAPGTSSIYSDLGFILLGLCAEAAADGSLATLATTVLGEVLADTASDDCVLLPRVPGTLTARTAPTRPLPEDLRRTHQLRGEVHDNYAAALGGFAGHAGLFGTAPGVGAIAQVLLRALEGHDGIPPFTRAGVTAMITPSRVPGSSRAIGWDTMRPTSSCGRYLSARAFGHVGFTGTSVWIDPERDRYYVLLTNRVCGSASSEDMQVIRRAFHEVLSAP